MGLFNDEIAFVHVPKCGGWSVKQLLREHLPGVVGPKEAGFPIGHIRLADFERFTGRVPASFKTIIAVIRNPYEQQLSQWAFWKDRFARYQDHYHDKVAAKYPRLEHWLKDPGSDFHVWYDNHFGWEKKRNRYSGTMMPITGKRYEDFGGFYPYWLAIDGTIPANVMLVKLEEVERVPALLEIDAPMPKLNPSPMRADPREYYSREAAEIVEGKFSWAFERYYEKWTWHTFMQDGKEYWEWDDLNRGSK